MEKILCCELISWAEIQRLCHRLTLLIKSSGYRPEIVVAIGRGGYVPARLVCDYLDIMDLTSIKIEHYLSGSTRQQQAVIRYPLSTKIQNLRVLLIDDVNDSGDTLRIAAEHLQSFKPSEIKTAVMHNKVVTDFPVDYQAKKIIKWRWLIYPWALKEDISDFLKRLSRQPKTVEHAQQLLAEEFDIKISKQQLKNIYALEKGTA